MNNSYRKPLRTNVLVAGGLALIVLALAVFLSNDYGQGWDDSVEAFYGRTISSAYSSSPEYFNFEFQSYFGPGYQLIQYHLTEELSPFLPSWKTVHIRYLVNFIFFQFGVLSVYLLARRHLSQAGALLAAALFLSQPVIFGHAFINHKDGVFLSLFTTSMALGLAMADVFTQDAPHEIKWNIPRPTMRPEWPSLISLLAPSLLLFLTLIDGALGFSKRLTLSLVTDAYRGTSTPTLNALFNRLAENRNSIPLSSYIEKVSRLSLHAHIYISALAAILIVVAILYRFPRETRNLYIRRSGLLLFSATSLGLTTATRLAGPLAGLIVAIYFILKNWNRRVVPVLVAYVIAAYVVTYALWPALWREPIGHLFEAFQVMSRFPAHDVLFMGEVLQSSDLPWHFLLISIAIQLTEPLLLLLVVAILGFGASLVRDSRRPPYLSLLPMFLWFAVPFILVPLFNLPNYGTFRHYLFITPPLFIMAASGATLLLQSTSSRLARLLLVSMILAPGVISSVRLHPYEYVYFNSFVNGVPGADGYYDLDYWCTSYKDAIEFVNQDAPPASTVVVWGPVGAVRTFSRPDLNLLSEGETITSPDYAISCSSLIRSPLFYATYETVFDVTVDGAVIARVKRNPTGQD
jgi:4-amino-4-deoxy-L-arabinose transferase-like glycosyltransferase